jgi:hypothetical protein
VSLTLPPPGETAAPRWGTRRNPDRPTRGGVDAQVAELLGWSFFPWQRDAADVAGEYEPLTRLLCYRTVCVGVARQNGKTTLVLARIARQLIPRRQTVAYTAQDRTVARVKWAEHVEILMDTPFAERVSHVDRTNHREMLVMHNGSRYMPVTPSRKKAARSMSIDLAVIDEAHAHDSMAVLGALQPTMVARPHAQLWVLSNAGDIDSVLWRHLTETGRLEVDNSASTMCWIEYAADPAAEVHDRHAWVEANPSLDLPGGVTSDALADAALTQDADTFRREHLNVWVDLSQITGIDAVTWAACRRDDLVPGEPVAFGLDFTPERDRGALVACGDVDGVTPLEVIEASSDLEGLVASAAERANRWRAPIVIDRGSPAASAVPALERATAYGPPAPVHNRRGVIEGGERRHRVRLIGQPDLVRACGDFHDASVHCRLSHRGDYRLTDAVASAAKRRVGDAWLWRRRGNSDISPLVAATLARWGIVTAPDPPAPARATIHTPVGRRVPDSPRR